MVAALLPLIHGYLREHVSLGLDQHGVVDVVPQDVEVSGYSSERLYPVRYIVK